MTPSLCLVAQDSQQLENLKNCFPSSRYRCSGRLLADAAVARELQAGRFDLVVFHVPAIGQATLALLQVIQQSAPRPVAVFVDTSSDTQVHQAIEAGANAYVVAGLSAARVEPVIALARARFQRCQALHQALSDTRQRLDERRDIERAKGILMHSKQLSEEEAYRLLRKLAMDRNQRLGELAQTVISAAQLLQ